MTAERDAHLHHVAGEHETPRAAGVPHSHHRGDDHDTHRPHGGSRAPTAHDGHERHSVAEFRDRFWVSLVLTIPTLVWGHMLTTAIGWQPPSFPGSQWIPVVFGTAVFVYGGRPFLVGAVHELHDRLPGMMTLVALAITVAFVYSLAVAVGYPGMPLWDELATLVTIMLAGHWIELRSVAQARGAVQALAKLLPNTAARVNGDAIVEVPINELRVGDLVLVRPGAAIPADGIVRDGSSDANESLLTGESRPVAKRTGDTVIAGTVNGTGSLRVEVTRVGRETVLSGIVRLVAQAQQHRSRAQALADRAAFALTVVAVVSALATMTAWLALGASPGYVVERVVAVLVIACPHALGLAIPLVIAISTALAARSGLIIRDGRALELARSLTIVAFDKTGTLTRGEFRVTDIATSAGVSPGDALATAAAAERDSEHTIARGIVRTADEQGIGAMHAADFRSTPGLGVQASVNGSTVLVGSDTMLERAGVVVDAALGEAARRSAERGESPVYVSRDGRAIAVLSISDAVRPESHEAVRALHAQRVRVVMVTGDADAVAKAVARQLGVDDVYAKVLPAQKAETIRALKTPGSVVGMVGDGVNDAPALASADVSVAVGAGADVAVEAGDVVLVRSDPRGVARLMTLSRATHRKMVQNLWWAAGYNIVAIPLAAGVLASKGIALSPAAGAVLMSLSTVIVAINAQLLRREAHGLATS